MDTTKTKDTLEKEWQKLVEKEILGKRKCSEIVCASGLEVCDYHYDKGNMKFMMRVFRDNLSSLPEVKRLIDQLKNHEDCEPECHEHYYFDKLLKKLESGK